MGLERYLKDEHGLRKYVELLESTPTKKRQTLIEASRAENPAFVAAAEKYLLTFDAITRLPDMEVTEVLGASGLKTTVIAIAIASVEDAAAKERLISLIPRNLAPAVVQDLKDNPAPKPMDIGGARLQLIKKARELESKGRLESVQIPHFGRDHFQKKAA